MQRSSGMTGAAGLGRPSRSGQCSLDWMGKHRVCGLLHWWRARHRFPATAEYPDDAHGAAAAGALFAQGERSDLGFGLWRGGLFNALDAEQSADFRDVCFACRAGQKAIVPDAAEAVR